MAITTPSLGIVIPAGPRDDVADTVESVLTYTRTPRRIVLIDDTDDDRLAQIADRSDDIDLIAPIHRHAARGGLLLENIAAGYRHLLGTFAFDAILRLDADALVIGPGLAERAVERFATDGSIGLLGASRIAANGGTRDWSWAAAALARTCGPLGRRHPETRRLVRRLRSAAISHGYVPGEGPQGGGYIHSPQLVRAMDERGLLNPGPLARCAMGEDQIFGLLAYACGFRIEEFGSPDGPLAVRWRGLPASPDQLIAQGSLVAHSVRFHGDRDEEQVRAWFRAHRTRSAPGSLEITPTQTATRDE